MEPNLPSRRRYAVHTFPGTPPPAPAPPQRPTPQEDTGLDFASVRDALRQGVWVILGTCAVVVAAVAIYTMVIPPEYEAGALVFVDTGSAESQRQSASVTTPGSIQPRRNLTNEIGRLTYSQDVRKRVAARLIDEVEAAGASSRFPILEPAEDRDSVSMDEISRRLYENVTFTGLGEQDMISIVAVSTTGEEAAAVANLYAEEYQKISLEESRASVVAARAYLEEQVNKLGAELDGIDDQIVAFSRNERVPQQGPDGGMLVGRYAAYQAQRDQAQIQLEQERRALAVIEEELAQIAPSERGTPPPSTAGLETEVAAYQQRVAQLRLQAESYYANDPSLQGNESRVPELQTIIDQIGHYEARQRQLEQRLADLVASTPVQNDAYIAGLEAQKVQRESSIRGLEAQIRALGAQIGSLDSQVQGIPRQTVQLAQLNRQRDMLVDWYSTFLRDLQQTLLAEESELGYVSIVSAARIPMFPERPKFAQNIVLAILLGLGFGIGLAFVRHASKQELAGPDDIEDRGFRVLGVVPSLDQFLQEAHKGQEVVSLGDGRVSTKLLTALDPWSPVAENFRLIRTNIDHMPVGSPQVILVTSAHMGEGKTLTSSNLAVAMASGGRRTLIIDADMRRPNAHNLITGGKVEGSTSLSSILSDEQWDGYLDEEDLKTSVPDLWLLPAGRPDVPPSELLRTKRLSRLLDYARSSFDTVVIDSPPELVATDVLVLAQLVDATVVVVNANGTDARAFEHTLFNLGGVGTDIAGVVVNRFDAPTTGSKYNQGYTYEYTKEYHERS